MFHGYRFLRDGITDVEEISQAWMSFFSAAFCVSIQYRSGSDANRSALMELRVVMGNRPYQNRMVPAVGCIPGFVSKVSIAGYLCVDLCERMSLF